MGAPQGMEKHCAQLAGIHHGIVGGAGAVLIASVRAHAGAGYVALRIRAKHRPVKYRPVKRWIAGAK